MNFVELYRKIKYNIFKKLIDYYFEGILKTYKKQGLEFNLNFKPLKKVWFFGTEKSIFENFKYASHIFPQVHSSHFGKLISIYSLDICWKDKWRTPRYEGASIFSVRLFNFLVFGYLFIPDVNNDNEISDFWENYLWCAFYNKCNNFVEGYKTWPWVDSNTSKTTFNLNVLTNYGKQKILNEI